MSETILIITPTTVEFDAMSRRLLHRQENHDDVITARGTIGSADVVVAMTGKGQESTSAAVTRLVDRTNARYVLLIGMAGIFGNVRQGDVVIPASVASAEFDLKLVQMATRLAEEATARWKKAIVVPRPDGMRDDATTAHVGSVANAMNAATAIMAVEMEAIGAAAAIRLQQSIRAVGLLMIRATSDDPQWKAYAADAAAAFATTLLETLQPSANVASRPAEVPVVAPAPPPRPSQDRAYPWIPIAVACITAFATIVTAFITKGTWGKAEPVVPNTGSVAQTSGETSGTTVTAVDHTQETPKKKKYDGRDRRNEASMVDGKTTQKPSLDPVVKPETSMLESLPLISGSDGPWAVVVFGGHQDRRDDVNSWVRDVLSGSGRDTVSLFRKVSDEQRVAPDLYRGSRDLMARLNAGRYCSRILVAKFTVTTIGTYEGLTTAEAKLAVHMLSPTGEMLKNFDLSERGGGLNDESAQRAAIDNLKEIVLRDLPSEI